MACAGGRADLRLMPIRVGDWFDSYHAGKQVRVLPSPRRPVELRLACRGPSTKTPGSRPVQKTSKALVGMTAGKVPAHFDREITTWQTAQNETTN